MKHFRKNIKYIISLLAVYLLLAACGQKTEEQNTEVEHHEEGGDTVAFTGEQYATARIELCSIENKQISGTIRVNGQLDVPPQQKVSVSVPMGGFLKSTPLLQGTKVRKGQAIATIENLDFVQIQQDYLDAEGQLEFAEADYQRQQELAKQNVAAEKTLHQAKTTYTSWKAKAAGLKEKLKVLGLHPDNLKEGKLSAQINLYSPINGYVTEVHVNIGKFVNPSDVLFEIVDTEHLHAELIVFEKDVPKLKIGQKVRFTLANEARERRATVYLIGRKIAADRTIQIHCHIDEEDTNLLPGMYLKAVVETGGMQVPALPDQAIIDFQGKKYIFYLLSGPNESMKDASEHTFLMVEIEAGHSEMGYTEVTLPVDSRIEGERIVVKNAYAILSKLKNSEGDEHGH